MSFHSSIAHLFSVHSNIPLYMFIYDIFIGAKNQKQLQMFSVESLK